MNQLVNNNIGITQTIRTLQPPKSDLEISPERTCVDL
jgi:hypothetical protein